MQLRPLAVTTLCIMLTVAPVFAKEKKHEKAMDPQAMMEVWKKLAQPGEPHKLFAGLAGSWTTQTKEWMEPGKPPMESTGTSEMKMLLDGRFLFQEYDGQMMGQPFSGVGIDGYDNLTKKYVTAWIDTMGTGIFFHGRHGKRRREDHHTARLTSHAWRREDVSSRSLEDRRRQQPYVRDVRRPR